MRFLRRSAAWLLCISLGVWVFSACGSKTATAPDLGKTFSCNANMEYNDFSATAELARMDNGAWEVKMLSPNSLKDIMLNYQNGDVTVSYKGLSFNLPDSALPVQGIADNMVNALDNASMGVGIEVQKSGDGYQISGISDDVRYNVAAEKDGTLLGLSMPDVGLEVTFENFAFGDALPDENAPDNADGAEDNAGDDKTGDDTGENTQDENADDGNADDGTGDEDNIEPNDNTDNNDNTEDNAGDNAAEDNAPENNAS